MRRVLALLGLVACHDNVPVVPVAAPLAGVTAPPPVAPPLPTAFTYDAFTSVDEDEFVGWQILFARRGDDARVLVRSRGTASLPVELAGTVKPDAGRLRVRASAGSAKDALRFDAVIDGDALTGALRSDTGREDVVAKRGVPARSDVTNVGLGADVDGHRFDVGWEQHGKNVKATVADVGRSRTLEGTMRDGRFELSGEGVTMRGVLSNFTAGIGEWIEDGDSRPMTLDLMNVVVPAPHALAGGARLVPDDRWAHGASGCPSSYDVYPKIVGLGGAEDTLNRLLHPGASASMACTGQSELAFLGAAWSTSTYVVTASRPGWLAIRHTDYAYMGGAHGTWGETCDVASLATGKVGALQSELSPASLTKLGVLVRKTLLAAAPAAQTLVDLGFTADDPDVTKDRVTCVVDDHGALALEVVYQSDMDPAGNFRFNDTRPHIPAKTARALFPPGSLGALVFQ